jgi:CRP-like cAMP-binding protein
MIRTRIAKRMGCPKGTLTEKIQGLKHCVCFTHLTEDSLKDAAVSATIRHYKRGEYILREGDLPSFYQVIQTGLVKILKQASSGRNFVLTVHSPGEVLNGVALVEGHPHFVSAQALDNVSIIRVRREDYLTLLERHPTAALRIIDIMDKVLAGTYERLVDIVGEHSDQRICNVLYMLYGKFGKELGFTTEEIADLAGTRGETASRVLARLKDLRIVVREGKRKLRIANEPGLANLSQGPFHL